MGESIEFYIEDIAGEELAKEIANDMKIRTKSSSNRRVKHVPIIKSHDILNFKNVKKISFQKFMSTKPIFKWGSVSKFFSTNLDDQVNLEKFFADREQDSLQYLYNKANNFFPICYKISDTRFDKDFITDFFTYLKPPELSYRATEYFGDQDIELSKFVLVVEDDLIIYYDDDLIIFLNPDKHFKKSMTNPFYAILCLLSGYKKKSTEKNQIHVVYKGDYGFDKMAFDVKKIDINIDTNYNDDFKDVSEYIIANLNDKNKTGLYILSGDYGTGKTTWLRYLAGKIRRNIIFVSPDMVDHITDPSFIPFLMNNSDSILIIEDAEPALQKRDGTGRTGAISNILNLTDGLLSDCLNISIVATFNTNTKTIDEALLRDGRLIKSYVFEKLSVEKSDRLLKKLGYAEAKATKPMALSEIYFYGKDNNGKLFKQSTNSMQNIFKPK